MTESDEKVSSAAGGLAPSATLKKCNGQDITRRGGKGKSRIMMVLPSQLALLKGCEGSLGVIDKVNTENPEFVVSTAEGDLVFTGHFIESDSLCYLGIDLTPKKMHSVCTDVISRVLVFSAPVLVPRDSSAMSPPVSLPRGASVKSAASEDIMLTQDTIVASQGTGAEDESDAALWQLFHGCSARARQFDRAEASLKRDASVLSRGGDYGESDIDDNDMSDSDFGDADQSSSAKKRKKKPPAKAVQRSSPVIDFESAEGGEDGGALRRPASSRSAKKAIAYNVDDIPSDDGIDDIDLVVEKKPAKKTAAPKDSTGTKAKAAPKKAAAKSVTPADAKPAQAPKATGKRKKDTYDFPSSDDEDYCEIVDDSSPKKRTSVSRPARASAKKTKTYHISSGSSGGEESDF